MSFNDQAPFQIPSHVIRTSRFNSNNTVADQYSYDLGAADGYIEIDPPIVRFAGFEVGKVNIAKVRIVNRTSKSQRMHILPPSTPYFSIKYDKKGQLDPGMSEDVFVQFTPNDYKYFVDGVRVHTSDEQLQIPIHGYPVMNKEGNKEVFPRVIDFNVCAIGATHSMRFPLLCKIPMNFEFEFFGLKETSQIKISPMKGVVPGKGSVEVEVFFTPTSSMAVLAEYELMVSEYEFEPIRVKIMGSGKLVKEKEKNLGDVLNKRASIRKSKYKPSETARVPTTENLRTSPERTNETMTNIFNTKENERPSKEDQMVPIIEIEGPTPKPASSSPQKSFPTEPVSQPRKLLEMIEAARSSRRDFSEYSDRQMREKQFLEKFNQISTLDKEKQVKFFQSAGDPKLSSEEEGYIIKERENHKEEFLNNYENDGISRYELTLDQGFPVLGEVYPKFYPAYDENKNDNVIKWKKRWRMIVNRVILKRKTENRLNQIKTFLAGAKTAAEVEKLVEKDWQKAEYFGKGKKAFVLFQFQYSNNSILDVRPPLQPETSAANISSKFELNQRIGFDDFTPIDPLPFSDIEVMAYAVLDPPMIINYLPIEANRKDRKGAEEEYSISGPMGPVEKVADTLELVAPMPSVLKKPLNIEIHKFVSPDPQLRTFTPYVEVTETDPEFYLQPAKIDFQDSLDPMVEGEFQTLYREYLSSAPGMEGIRAVASLPIDFTNYYTHKFNLVPDFGFEEKWEKLCPDLLDKAYDEDKFTDKEKEDKGLYSYEMPDVEDFLDKLENDEPKIKDLRLKNEGDIWDEHETAMTIMNKNFENEKRLWNVTLTTKVYEVDKNISNRDKMLNLL